MNKKTLERAKRKINRLRGNDVPSIKLENIAESIGRTKKSRGSYTWVSKLLPDSRPISIPHHGKPVTRFTAEGILDDFERDIFDLEEKLEKQNE